MHNIVAIETKAVAEKLSEVRVNERIVFLAETDFKAWTSIVGLDKRFKACNVSDTLAKVMTTEALIESIIHYPLNYIILFDNIPEESIETIVQNSALHRELLTREDATEKLIDRYSEARPVSSKSLLTSECALMIEDDLVLGFLIQTNITKNQIEQTKIDSLGRRLEEKVNYIETVLEPFRNILMEPLSRIAERLCLSSNIFARSGGEITGYCTIRTPLFQPLDGYQRTEWSDDVIAYYDNEAITNHPGATLIGHSSAKYNCHSFAWYQSSTNNQVWLNAVSPLTNTFQLGKYWTADLYESCLSVYGQKIYYSGGDHSANMLPNGKYLSKWGPGPLMEHVYNDCPYTSTNLQFYREKDLPLFDTVEITGPDYVALNVANTYEFSHSANNNIHNVITAEGLDPNSSCSFNQIGTDTYSLVCHDYGAFEINVQTYASYNGSSILYSYSNKLVICTGYQ